MKATVITAVIASACAGNAMAQSTVSIYGIADAGFVSERGGTAGTVNKITSGVGSASRIGFRASESLGGGMSALFTIETGFRIDSGEADSASNLFNRQAFVGIKSPLGTLSFGRQYTPWHQVLTQVADPFGGGYAPGAKNLFPDSGTNVRSNNSVVYSMPVTNGLSADLAYSLGEQSGSSSAGRQAGFALGYSSGPLNLRLAYNNKNSDIAAAPGVAPVNRSNGINKLIAANYQFGIVKAYFALGIDKGFNSAPLGNPNNPYGGVRPTPSIDGREVLLGLSVKALQGTILASVMHKDDKTAFDQDASGWGVGYLYPLSVRTTLYGAYGAANNHNGAGYTVANNTEPGSGDRAFNAGIRHSF